MPVEPSPTFPCQRVLVFGATGTIGRACVAVLLGRGHRVVCVVRQRAGDDKAPDIKELCDAEIRHADLTDPRSLDTALKGDRFDAVISCMASRTGVPNDAWDVDYHAQMLALEAASETGVGHFVLLSAICVQKPKLAFQHAKLAFEEKLIASGLRYSIVRPTAFFKSLSGQIDRVRQGKPFLVFGDGKMTACKPISDRDLGAYLADCLQREEHWNRVLPIGGPGPAITPLDQANALFDLLGQTPRIRKVPLTLMSAIIGTLSVLGRVLPGMRAKAELARIGRYYATESMLVWDAKAGAYDADATPSTGSDTLFEFYKDVIEDHQTVDRGDHSVF